jgi:hypothetical protein
MAAGNRKKNTFILWTLLGLCLVSLSCDPKFTPGDPAESFSKVYDITDELIVLEAVDMKQTPDGGYIILGKLENVPYLLRVDRAGNFLWEVREEFFPFAAYLHPIPGISILNQPEGLTYFLFCSKQTADGTSSTIALLKVIETDPSRGFTEVPLTLEHPGGSFDIPLDAKRTPDQKMLLLAVDAFSNQVLFSKINPDGSPVWEKMFPFSFACANMYPVLDQRNHFFESMEHGENPFYSFQSYLPRDGVPFPGCFGITLVNPVDGTPFETFPVPLPFIALHRHGFTASGAILVEGAVYFFIDTRIDREFGQENLLLQFDLIASRPVYTRAVNLDDQEILLFLGSEKTKRIVLTAYNLSRGSIVPNKKYFGHTNVYEAAGLTRTADGGLAVLGTTYLAGQLGRICLFKLSKEELEQLVGQY